MIRKTTISRSKNGDARRLSVGVTLFLRDGSQSIWENGIFQNCFFLLMLLKQSPFVERCFIVNGGSNNLERSDDFLAAAPAPIIGFDAAMNELDVVIELSAQLNPDWGRQFVAQGGQIVGMRVANDFVIDVERMAYGLPPALLLSPVPYREIWTLPAFERTCASYYRTGFRAPVKVMPHLWSPCLLERYLSQETNRRFEYVPGRERWRLAILEPNLCSVKTCHLPMLAADLAHRLNPTAIDYVRVFNAATLKERQDFVSFARSLDLVQQGLATFEPRYRTFDVMGPITDAIVSHHWENAQNYLYYEALYGGFPLIHNSTMLDGCGYAYRTFDPEDAALSILQALLEHDRSLKSYRACAEAFLRKLDPSNDSNIAAFGEALVALFETSEVTQ